MRVAVAVLAVSCTLGSAAPAAGTAPARAVAPGGMVVWQGAGTTRCGQGGATWEPLGDRCWYPIDLLAPAGGLELARWRGGRRDTARVEVTDYPYDVQHIRLDDDSRVHLSPSDLARSRREAARVRQLWARRGARRFELPLSPPLAELPAGGRFGSRRFFNDQPRSPHSGADFAAAEGTPVLAAADGVVALADDLFFSGKSVFLDHGDGLVTMYFHLSELAVEPGAEVARGQRIGRVGQTGRATGPHLHFGARWRGARIDPAQLLGRTPPLRLP